jgi:hypothetical protein
MANTRPTKKRESWVDRLGRLMRTVSNSPSAIERAFQLAKSGKCFSIRDIRKALKAAQYTNHEVDQLLGPSLQEQLKQLIAVSRSK